MGRSNKQKGDFFPKLFAEPPASFPLRLGKSRAMHALSGAIHIAPFHPATRQVTYLSKVCIKPVLPHLMMR